MASRTLSPSLSPSRAAGRRFPGILALLSLWQQRRSLGELDARRLADLGLTPEQASAEARRPVWDVPAVWRG